MTTESIKAAMAEATRFLLRASKALKRAKLEAKEEYGAATTKEMAATRRASMDLTRALAEMRKS